MSGKFVSPPFTKANGDPYSGDTGDYGLLTPAEISQDKSQRVPSKRLDFNQDGGEKQRLEARIEEINKKITETKQRVSRISLELTFLAANRQSFESSRG